MTVMWETGGRTTRTDSCSQHTRASRRGGHRGNCRAHSPAQARPAQPAFSQEPHSPVRWTLRPRPDSTGSALSPEVLSPEIVGCGHQLPLAVHGGLASSVKPGEFAVEHGLGEHRLDCLGWSERCWSWLEVGEHGVDASVFAGVVGEVEFAQDAPDVRLDRFACYEELFADPAVGSSLCH